MEGYEYEVDVDVRYRDLDPLGHVNHVVHLSYFEHARTSYYEDVLGIGIKDMELMLVNIEIDYETPITYGDEVTAGVGVSEIGEKSMTMEYRIVASGETAATGETVQVTVAEDEDGNHQPVRVPKDWRHGIEEYKRKR